MLALDMGSFGQLDFALGHLVLRGTKPIGVNESIEAISKGRIARKSLLATLGTFDISSRLTSLKGDVRRTF